MDEDEVPGDICRLTFVSIQGREWICVKKVHAKIYQRHSTRKGQLIFNNNPQTEKHYFVRRWPHRNTEETDD